MRGTRIRAVIKHSPRHNGSLPTHALTLGELAHNITPGHHQEKEGREQEESWEEFLNSKDRVPPEMGKSLDAKF